jgi:hypothetical protein
MKNILIVIAVFLAVFVLVVANWNTPSGRYYNCRDIDFLPDVPPQVRTECRKIIKEQMDQRRRQEQDRSEITI